MLIDNKAILLSKDLIKMQHSHVQSVKEQVVEQNLKSTAICQLQGTNLATLEYFIG